MIHILRSSRSLAQVLILPFIILILVLSLLVGFLSYFAGRQAVISVADRMLLETVERVGLAVDRHVFGAAAVLETAFPTGLTVAADIEQDLASMRSRFWIATSLHLDPNNYVYYGNRAGQFVGLFRHSMTDGELRVKNWPATFRSAYRFNSINGELSAPKNEETSFDPVSVPGIWPQKRSDMMSGAASISTSGKRTWSRPGRAGYWGKMASFKAWWRPTCR